MCQKISDSRSSDFLGIPRIDFSDMTQLESNITEKHQWSSSPFTNVWLSPDDKEKLVFFALLPFDASRYGKPNCGDY